MSQDPLKSIRRKAPRPKGTFPDPDYLRDWLDPASREASSFPPGVLLDVHLAHALMLGEQRIVDPEVVANGARRLLAGDVDTTATPGNPLAQAQAQPVGPGGEELLMALAMEEITVTACRIVLRERLLEFASAVLDARDSVSTLASGHLTTLMLASANGQVVQPTSLGHYLAGQLGPLVRTQQRLHEAYARLNRSPMGAGSGMSTAMPIRRGRVADLLGFEGVIDNTVDAVAGSDVNYELVSIVAGAGIELTRLVADLAHWSRDDVGLLTPGDEFVHSGAAQPQRRDPLVIDYLRVASATLSTGPAALLALLQGQPGLGGDATRMRAFSIVEEQLSTAARTYRLLASVARTAVVNRAMFANRTNRGFSTSSELADLLMVDFGLERSQAMQITERVVIDAIEAGGDATTLTTEAVDRVALRLIGREIGIEPEMLARCLAPKRFVERRTATGAPAPASVGQALEREQFLSRKDRGWLEERRVALETARAALLQRANDVAERPEAVLTRPEA
ncbi:MAG TPA: lyase family protein [Thermomicrobiales bacterium]|nr:lyase family protein [Thermomicrobiales bacterium]